MLSSGMHSKTFVMTRIPTDAAGILDWGLDTAFTSQDRPSLAIAMTVTVDRTRCIRRYRVVVAQMRLGPEVSTAFASRTADHRLTASGCSIDGNSCMAMQNTQEKQKQQKGGAPNFFRPTPSWLPPGRPTRSIACCKIGLVN